MVICYKVLPRDGLQEELPCRATKNRSIRTT